MADDGFLERERYQIEQIRQLESEELQVEEVDDESSDGDDDTSHLIGGGASTSGEFTYDTSLAALHSYLGDVDDTHNRMAFLDGGAVLNVPIIYLEGVVLFPEATLPLRVVQPNFISGIEKALRQADAPYTIGVVRVYRDPDNRSIKFATTGTTAEIRRYRQLEDESLNVLTRGQQRFRLRRKWIDVDGAPFGEIQIIQEDLPLRTPKEAIGKLTPLKNLRPVSTVRRPSGVNHRYGERDDSDAMSEGSFENELSPTERRLHHSALVSNCGDDDVMGELTSSDEEKIETVSEYQSSSQNLDNYMGRLLTEHRKRSLGPNSSNGKRLISEASSFNGVGVERRSFSHLHEVPRAFWPNWVYRMYDAYLLAQRAADRWKEIVRAPNMDAFVRKPDILSFHIASKIPVSESKRQELLEIDGTSYRLDREIELLESFDRIRCKTCEALIARRSDMLVMSSEGPLGAYANPHGFVHEVMTLHRASGLAVFGQPQKEYSWFPGYAWSIAECATCESQLGWLFTATKKGLKPRSFWGIRSSQVADEAN